MNDFDHLFGVVLPASFSAARPVPCCEQSQGVRFAGGAVMEHRWWLDANGVEGTTAHVLVSFCPWCGKRYERAPG